MSIRVYNQSGEAVGEVARPKVFEAPIRPDIVNFVHTQLAKNHRQAYGVSQFAGTQCHALSWGPGRAVARVPRRSGGVAAYANFCRGGHMFAPNTVERRWNRKVNLNIRRYAVASAIAASTITSLVQARGHKIEKIPCCPLVVELGEVKKTKEAVAVLKALNASQDCEKVAASRNIRAGRGAMRNRRYTQRVGPLVIFNEERVNKAFRNIPGIELCHVSRLNLLQLAPGNHMGRFCIWTKSAIEALDDVYAAKKNYSLPQSIIQNTDYSRLILSDAVSNVLRPARGTKRIARKINPFTNRNAMMKLNPARK